MLDANQGYREEGEDQPDAEVQNEITNVEMPWFRSIYVWSLGRAAEDVICYNVPWNADEFLIEERIYSSLYCLHNPSASQRRRHHDIDIQECQRIGPLRLPT